MHAERRVYPVRENEGRAAGGGRSAAVARGTLTGPRGLCGGGAGGGGEGGEPAIPVAGRRRSVDRPGVGQWRAGGKIAHGAQASDGQAGPGGPARTGGSAPRSVDLASDRIGRVRETRRGQRCPA